MTETSNALGPLRQQVLQRLELICRQSLNTPATSEGLQQLKAQVLAYLDESQRLHASVFGHHPETREWLESARCNRQLIAMLTRAFCLRYGVLATHRQDQQFHLDAERLLQILKDRLRPLAVQTAWQQPVGGLRQVLQGA